MSFYNYGPTDRITALINYTYIVRTNTMHALPVMNYWAILGQTVRQQSKSISNVSVKGTSNTYIHVVLSCVSADGHVTDNKHITL